MANLLTTYLISNIHKRDLKSIVQDKDNFTILSLHDASPDYIKSNDYDFIDFLSKSSLCQDEIIKKSISTIDTEEFNSQLNDLNNTVQQSIEFFENNVSYNDINGFSFYTSLVRNSTSYFSGEDNDFGYALNILNPDKSEFKNILCSNSDQNNFKNFFKFLVGYSDRNDSIINGAENVQLINENEKFKITENIALLSLVQNLNIYLLNSSNKALTHGTNIFKNISYNYGQGLSDKNLLTFNKRQSEDKNTVIGSVLNSFIHLNDFDEKVENFSSETYNVEKTRNQISSNYFSDEILKTESVISQDLISGDTNLNRNGNFIIQNVLEDNIPVNYLLLMQSILKTNRSITNLGVREDFDNVIYRPQNRRTFIQNANIETNNILFGKNNDDKNSNLSLYIQNVKKKISNAKSRIFSISYRNIVEDDTLLSILYGRSANRDSEEKADLYSKIGITHNENDSLIHRRSEDRYRDLFIYNDVDIFETNNYLSNKTGFNYFSRANIEELDSVIERHNVEKQKVESIVDIYYNKKLNNVNIYQELLKKASEGVSFSLDRFNNYQTYEYGNLPVDLLEEVAFISRFTGNTSYTLENFIDPDNKAKYKRDLARLLYAGSRNSESYDILLRSYNQHTIADLLRKYDLPDPTILQSQINVDNNFNRIYENGLDVRPGSFRDFSRSVGVVIANFFKNNFSLNVPENDFRRYAKDLNSRERESNRFLSPRYFLICGIPFPDVYSFNNRQNYTDLSENNVSIEVKDRSMSQGMSLFYKPLLGIVANSQTNSLYPSSKETNIFTQFAKRTDGIFKSYIEFLDKHLSELNINNSRLDDINDDFIKNQVMSFILNTFEAYCNIVISKLSQTFEYMTILNAVKIHSEAPVDFFLGIDPLDIRERIKNRLNRLEGVTKTSSDGLLGGSIGRGNLRENFSKSAIQRKRSIYLNKYEAFLSDEFIVNGIERDVLNNRAPAIDEDNRRSDDTATLLDYNRAFITENRRWLFPYKTIREIPRYQFSINFKEKSSNRNKQNGWTGRSNQVTARPSTINNILETLYHKDNQAKNIFTNFFDQNEYTDLVLQQNDSNYEFARASGTQFTGGAFHKEIFTWNSIRHENVNINDRENNDNVYLDDLFLEVNQFLYRKNLNFLNRPEVVDVNDLDIFDSEPHISYLSQYNANYPIIQNYNYAINIYNSLVKSPYNLVSNSLQNSLFFMPEESQYKDAIFNPLYKIYGSLYSADLVIAYLFDAYRYGFNHFSKYKEYLQSLDEEEISEEEISEEDQFGIDRLTNIVSKHYDFPENFDFRDYSSKLNASQKSLIKYNINNKTNYLTNNASRLVNNQNVFNDAKLFSSIFRRKENLKIACIGLREDLVGTDDKNFNIKLSIFDPISKLVSRPKQFTFRQDLFVLESLGNESSITDYKLVEYNYLNRAFVNVALNLNNETKNHLYSFLSKKYLLVTSGYGIDENSLKLDLDNTTARKSETPRVTQEVVESVNSRIENLNDDYNEIITLGENLLVSDNEFVNIQTNIDFNIKNDVYTDIIDTNVKAKQDIYKRMLLFNYKNFSIDSLGEIYMPKEFTKVLYVPFYDHDFEFTEENVQIKNNYVLKVDIEFE